MEAHSKRRARARSCVHLFYLLLSLGAVGVVLTLDYQSVCIYVDVANGEEVKAIFAALKKDTRLRYFL